MSAEKASRTVAVRATDCMFVVLACDDMSQAESLSQRLLQMNRGALVVYGRLKDLMVNPPSGKIAVVVLDTHESPTAVRRALDWLRRRWSHCPITVVGDAGGGDQEMTARQGGASFLTRPVTEEQWSSLLSHALAPDGWNELRDTPVALA